MCGIVAYLGNKNAYEIIIKGLQRLEYRGYDSAGVALHNEKTISVYKQKGKVKDLEDFVAKKDISRHPMSTTNLYGPNDNYDPCSFYVFAFLV